MLSRVAERIYWMCRYLERAENTARLVAVYGELLLDLPAEAQLDWSVPLEILGLDDAYRFAASGEDELQFLLAGQANFASLLASLNQARENARTTRDVIPSEAWQAINEMHLFVEENLATAARRAGSGVPAEILSRCHEITGIIEGGMSHGPAYQFVQLGRSLERADMSSRMIDVAASLMLTGREELVHHSNTIWRAVLRALSAYQMYRQYVRRRVSSSDVVRFLMLDGDFPRAVMHCVSQLEAAAASLPHNSTPVDQVRVLQERLAAVDLQNPDFAFIHQLVDDLQIEFASLHTIIFDTWLNPGRAT